MMPRTTEWLNANQYRAYPFVEDANMTLSNGTLLPLSVILDLVAINYSLAGSTLALVQLSRSVDVVPIYLFTFRYGTETRQLSVPASIAVPATSRTMGGAEVGMALTVVFGNGITELADIIGAGVTVTCQIPVEAARVVVQTRRRVDSVGADGTALTGRVYLEEGYNARIGVLASPATIWLSAGYGLGAGVPCISLAEGGHTATCEDAILRINGLSGSDAGDFVLAAGPGVEIIPDAANHTLVIRGHKKSDENGCAT